MKRFWILVSILWLATCGGGGGSPTEPKEPAPVANFTATPTTLIQGQAVTFTSTSTGTITSYAWNVDDDPAIEGTTATYTHTYEEVGTYSVTLTVTGPGGSNPKTVADMITVSTAAPTPTTETSQTVQEDGSTTISLTATDPNGQAVTFAITTDPTNGTATLSGTEITYTPNANFYGTDTVAYTASNGTYTSDPVTITITVEGQDDEPTTNDVSATTDEDTAVTVNLDATEIDGDNYSFSIISQPSNGTLGSINGNQVEYTPNQDFNGTDTFTFEATDDRTFRRNVATATITVNPVNDAPVANDVTASMNENKEFTRLMPVNITLDATDVEGDDLTYSIVGTPSNGTLGSITNNQVIYTPSQDWNGEDTFTYKANDGTADSNTATVTVTVTSVNDAPVTTDQTASTDEDTAVDITLTATDVENDNLTFTIVSDVSNGTTSLSGATVTYTPTANFNGTDTFTFKANDGTDDSNTSTVTITIASVNDAPVANDVTASTQSRTGNMRQAVTITLDATDVEGDDLTYSLVSDVSNGSTSLSGSTLTYTPTANYDGTDTFTYKANDGTADSNTATGTITITDVNNVPIANDMNFLVDRDTFTDLSLNASDLDGDNLSSIIVLQPSNGTLIPGTGLDYTYTQESGYFGIDSFNYKVNDGTSDSDVKTVSFEIDEGIRYFGDTNLVYYDLLRTESGSYFLYTNQWFDQDTHKYRSYIIEFDDNFNLIEQKEYPSDYFVWSYPFVTAIYNFDFKKVNNGFLVFENRRVKFFDSEFNQINGELYPNDVPSLLYDVEQLNDGTIFLSGSSNQIFKIDSSLTNVWKKTYFEHLGDTSIREIVKLSDGNLFAASDKIGFKIDLDGNILWSNTDLGTLTHKILEQNNKIFIFARNYVVISDLSGNKIGQFNYGPFKIDQLKNIDIIFHSSGDIVFCGMTDSNEILVQRTTEDGSVVWNEYFKYDFISNNSFLRSIESSDGNLILMVSTKDYRKSHKAEENNLHGVFKVDINDGTKLLP
jgi:PKD repeat protein